MDLMTLNGNPPVVLLEEFFAPQEMAALWSFAMGREPSFVSSQVIGDDDHGVEDRQFRRSRVLFDVGDVYPFFTERILRYLPHVRSRLGHEDFAISEVELQITATNDGEWFRAHTDSGQGAVSGREITFVYFCHREPRGFSGGELWLWNAAEGTHDGQGLPPPDRVVVPAQNSVVFFPSEYLHEVTSVSCPSQAFLDSRLTFNGWVHR